MKNKTKYGIITSKIFEKHIKKFSRYPNKLKKISEVIKMLADGQKLDIKYRDHQLYDNKYYKECRECHIEPDLLLIYKYANNNLYLYLLDIGTHSNLFN